MLALRWQGRSARPRRTIALAASILLHLAVGYSVGRVSWEVVSEDDSRVISIVWIDEWPRAAPESIVPRADETVPMLVDERPPAEPTDAGSATDSASASPPTETPTTQEVEPASGGRGVLLPPGTDWERERQNAVERVLEAQERDAGRITFSTEELFEEPAEDAPNPREHMFDSPQRGPSRSAFTPGQARSRFGNRIAELCNALTGGGLGITMFGFGVGTLCADPGPGADFFADIRPAYMESLPVCVETWDPLLNPEPSNEFPTIKCRLVPKDELE